MKRRRGRRKKRLGIISFIAIGESMDCIRSNVFSGGVEKKLEKKERKIFFCKTSKFHGSVTHIFSEDASNTKKEGKRKKKKEKKNHFSSVVFSAPDTVSN